ncbi:hypothetical protein IFM89_029813 [Coptis chinensis]|uniref:Uncharacterized protein n=1 Tax=Coptis chinensis TaxID=261450 RepID=A0A835LT74_9MAGN|nr:hypothetical protein IFM89_029813 [Coptis chinensis]
MSRRKAFHFRQMTRSPALPPSGLLFPPYAMLPRRPTYHASAAAFRRGRSLPCSAILPPAVWAGCPSLPLRSVRLWITGTNVVEWGKAGGLHAPPRAEM